MKSITGIPISEYGYHLPDDRIAKHPLPNRDESKLLIYNNKNISCSTFSSIPDSFTANDLLVFNNTRVVQARLRFKKDTGASIEVFLLDPIDPADYQQAFGSTATTTWRCMVGNIKRWKHGELCIPVPQTTTQLTAKLIDRDPKGGIIEFNWNSQNYTFAQIIELCGEVPIPPYLNRTPEKDDRERYQTVYAKPEGSVAAPTAGLHFTQRVLDSIASVGTSTTEVTLHVGAGTFQPVKSDTIGGHEMHTERIYITLDTIDKILKCNGKVISIGTTSLRTIESLYWLGAKLIEAPKTHPSVEQWDGYSDLGKYSTRDALNALRSYISSCDNNTLSTSTQMIIVPGYQFRVADALVTNYHQPRSTLLLLVAAFIGDDWRRVYSYALQNNFRFLSYGDSSLLVR